jgi:hypothetical protein
MLENIALLISLLVTCLIMLGIVVIAILAIMAIREEK